MISKEPDLYRDPFGERSAVMARPPLQLLGARFRFASDSAALLDLADAAFAGLPRHRIAARAPDLRLTMRVTPSGGRALRSEPPRLAMASGAGLLAAGTHSSSYVMLDPQAGAGLVVVSPAMLRFPYHTRYELIEFAVYTLAARAQRLVSLHCACVALGGKAILLMGESGSGKSTVALQCLLAGLEIVSEDSTFVAPGPMLATGIANFLHVRPDSLRWVDDPRDAALIRSSAVIRRRSGARKFELDLRAGRFRLAASAARVRAVVFLSKRSAPGGPLLRRLARRALLGGLRRDQAYAAGLPGWDEFCRGVTQAGGFELRRGRHPCDAAAALRDLLQS